MERQYHPTPGMRITKTTRFPSGIWILPNTDQTLQSAAVMITGSDITVDFQGATLRGTAPATEPNQRIGTGIIVLGKNVTLRNVNVHGYKVGIAARYATGLNLENVNASWNWKQRLASTPEKEDTSDWMSYHQNEQHEWLRYGAAIYLDNTDDFVVRSSVAVGGQNGLMLTNCNRGKIYHNTFSFLSSVGIGLYRSCWNHVLHNSIDWCVRGYSHGIYNRGQDSAGILVYEQSSNNVFAYNSVTHGGDGFFLWAGQNTMDTGRGGSDDNLLYANDFSHAPTNGIEATFSRNAFVHNVIAECWHGVWGGYSYETKIIGNVFGYNAEAIAIEHGRDNALIDNGFFRDRTAVRLWANPSQDPSWAYVRKHATSSQNYTIEGNTFVNVQTKFDIKRTDSITNRANRDVDAQPFPTPTMQPNGNTVVASENNLAEYLSRWELDWHPDKPSRLAAPYRVQPMGLPTHAMLKKGTLRGRRYIIVDAWGPYDFKSPRLIQRSATVYEILGPKGTWRIIAATGLTLAAQKGTVPTQVSITPIEDYAGAVSLVLEYIGLETLDYKGNVHPKGTPIKFGFTHFSLPIDWDVAFYRWTQSSDPGDVHAPPNEKHFVKQLQGPPFHSLKSRKLDFSGATFLPQGPDNHFITVATGSLTAPKGNYVIDLVADDGVRIWIDGQESLQGAWKYQGPTLYAIPIQLNGIHRIRIEHFQIDGFAALNFAIRQVI